MVKTEKTSNDITNAFPVTKLSKPLTSVKVQNGKVDNRKY